MDFYDFTTLATIHRQERNWSRFYAERLLDIEEARKRHIFNPHDLDVGNNQIFMESRWWKNNRPYYKIWPDFVPMLIKTKLAIPMEYFKLPYDAIVIRLPKDNLFPFLTVDKEKGLFARAIGICYGSVENAAENTRTPEMMMMYIDFGEREEDHNISVFSYQNLPIFDKVQTVQEIFDDNKTKKEDYYWGADIPDQVVLNCLKLAVTVSLLATGGHELLEADVLSRDLQRYLEASEERKLELAKKAKKLGKFGWTLGRSSSERSFLSPRRQIGDNENRPAQETDEENRRHWELQYSHMREGHFHIVRHGPARQQYKIMWYFPTVVREDLPPAPFDHRKGFQT